MHGYYRYVIPILHIFYDQYCKIRIHINLPSYVPKYQNIQYTNTQHHLSTYIYMETIVLKCMYKLVLYDKTKNMINISMKILYYGNSCMFDTPSQIPVQYIKF